MSTTTLAAPIRRKRHLRDHARTGRIVLTGLWADAVLVMASSAYNGGEAFTALHQPQGQGIALGVAVDVALAVALVGDRALHLEDRTSAWGRGLRIVTALMSLALNCGVTLWQGHLGVAVFHAFLPILLVLLSEYAQDITLQFGEIADEYKAAEKAELDAQLRADREKWEAQQAKATAPSFPTVGAPVLSPAGDSSRPPVGPAVAPAFRAVPNWTPIPVSGRPAADPAERSETSRSVASDRSVSATRNDEAERFDAQPAERPMPRPDQRSGTARRSNPGRRTGKPRGSTRTDADLTAELRDMADTNGEPPSIYAAKQALGIGSSRATRLVAALDSTPAAPHAGNGAASTTTMRKDDAE